MATNWTIFVYTSDRVGAGTDANVYMQVFGAKSSSAQFSLENKSSASKNKKLFEAGQCDRFDKSMPGDLCNPQRVRNGHDNKGTQHSDRAAD